MILVPVGEKASRRNTQIGNIESRGSTRSLYATGTLEDELNKVWSSRSMCQLADFGTFPAGLPHGLTDNEKKLWLALYTKSKDLLKGDDLAAIRVAFDSALNEVTEKHSLEFRFGVRWAHSVRTCLHMEERHEAFRSSDIYS